MSEDISIFEAAAEALKSIGRPASIKEIFNKIQELSLYEFNTPVPEHVLRTQIRRATTGVEIEQAVSKKLFIERSDEIYGLMSIKTSKSFQVGMRRIHRATDKEAIIKVLTSDKVGVFREIWRLLLFAATLGYKQNKRESLGEIESGKGIDQSTFGNCPSWPGITYLIALVENGNTESMMANEEAEQQRITCFEEYANGGLAILAEEFSKCDENIDSLLSFISSKFGSDTLDKPDLSRIAI